MKVVLRVVWSTKNAYTPTSVHRVGRNSDNPVLGKFTELYAQADTVLRKSRIVLAVGQRSKVNRTIGHRKHTWLGHIPRHESFLSDITEDKVTGY